jgi:uncharacterized protein YebE (UPF0316 family)
MPVFDFSNFDLFAWVALPLMIFCARVVDVSLGTLRIIFMSRGRRALAPILGFFEVFIWVVAISQIMRDVNNPVAYVAYAAGFATGNFVGMTIEARLAIGTLIVRMIVPRGADALVEGLHAAGYGVTSVDGRGATGEVKLIYTIIKRKDLADVTRIAHAVNPKVFLSVEEVSATHEGIFPRETAWHLGWRFRRK